MRKKTKEKKNKERIDCLKGLKSILRDKSKNDEKSQYKWRSKIFKLTTGGI